MNSTRTEIERAVKSLQMPASKFRALPDAEAESVFQAALKHFVNGGDRRWWWEAFVGKSVSRKVDNGWKLLACVVPAPDQNVWFIAEDDQLTSYPVFDATPEAVEQVIGECFGFEYYLIAKDMTWLLCENHHDYLIAVGEPVASRLSQLAV
jgi:hypothetical protein